jgi:carbon storage regulator CsrA
MLVLTRREGERIVTSNRIRITVQRIDNQVSLSFEAPDDVQIWREEIAPAEMLGRFATADRMAARQLAPGEEKETRVLVRDRERMAPIRFTLQPTAIVILVAQLQLASRHPANQGDSAAWARGFAEYLIDCFSPESQALLNRGWDSAWGTPVAKPE